MISVTKLLCNSQNFGDKLRYVKGAAEEKHGVSPGRGPVVVWNCTKTCNLKCVHCYANSDCNKYEGELSLTEAKSFINDLGEFRVPVILFSGGEPLLRNDIFELIEHSSKNSIRSTISTNGTLIDKEVSESLKKLNVGYVGVSLDGIGSRHDEFRKTKGSFDKALRGIRNCLEINQKVGLRFTINQYNYDQLEDIFRLIKEERIPRVCFYHLVYSGRGSEMMKADISKDEARSAMDLIIEKTMELGKDYEILTVDNHADSVYIYLQMQKRNPKLAEKVWDLISKNGGNRSGMAFGNVDYYGEVHPDQFTWQYTFGNVKYEKFSNIWKDSGDSILEGLRNRKTLLKGRCSRCKWISVCNGNFRTRAEAVSGDFWDSDPACYLTDTEIGI
ncbi:putative heme d1 biosynthesis radical SAM protein NirJ1 [Clostridiaceae bacterium UIB06]|uniref:Mycofactocin maturase MftC n=1 Tax=Clostridium thailandense TaxID=2794346 RepID=A0A949TYN0_9CLOT|nr:putative heme d1 biosynthesis radical SAM protein NirJ1 [Clostridium thailandense]MBV7272939.1 putative heme d1 biosynthesis radical SAM protein NirJ1 [Clostridium thailandense]MCH5136250.1 putative heme d1 biosynthesis radical SAM protein NirJ1 [Clostridiaceae bacterium UIB06]